MTSKKSSNIVWHEGRVDRARREEVFCQKGATLWFTGLSGSGKSTLAFTMEHLLTDKGFKCYVLDGDNVRHGLNNNLGFSDADREENIRRVGEVSKLFADAGMIVLSSFISPFRRDRHLVREMHAAGALPFIEVFMDTPLDVCEDRDPKQLYEKARRGEIKNFTGIDSPYEVPDQSELVITPSTSPKNSARLIYDYLVDNNLLTERS
jgi:adenylylsulfate kinase